MSNRKVRALTTRAPTTIVRSVGHAYGPNVRAAAISVLMWFLLRCRKPRSDMHASYTAPAPAIRGQCPLLGRTICPTTPCAKSGGDQPGTGRAVPRPCTGAGSGASIAGISAATYQSTRAAHPTDWPQTGYRRGAQRVAARRGAAADAHRSAG